MTEELREALKGLKLIKVGETYNGFTLTAVDSINLGTLPLPRSDYVFIFDRQGNTYAWFYPNRDEPINSDKGFIRRVIKNNLPGKQRLDIIMSREEKVQHVFDIIKKITANSETGQINGNALLGLWFEDFRITKVIFSTESIQQIFIEDPTKNIFICEYVDRYLSWRVLAPIEIFHS